MSNLDEAYRRGVAEGRAALAMQETSPDWMEAQMAWMRKAYPRCAGVDLWSEILRLDRERMDNPPDAVKFPETRGLADEVRRERQGFMDGAGCDEKTLAFHRNRFFFATRRLNTRYAGSSPENLRAGHCTGVYIRDTAEGGPLFGRNLDDVRLSAELEAPYLRTPSARHALVEMPMGENGRPWMLRDNVSSAVLGDEEPGEIFPLDAWSVMPSECRDLSDMISFLDRYRDFWGPCNTVLVDYAGHAAALEKSNCRLGVRLSDNGVAAVTACSYLVPELNEFKNECGRRVLADDAPDWEYWRGCDLRHHRLLALTEAAWKRGATLEDMGNIMTDHAVPFPDRICLAGETGVPGETDGNWTWTSKASVIGGPNRRTLFWAMRGDVPVYGNPPVLVTHDDLANDLVNDSANGEPATAGALATAGAGGEAGAW